jgi:4-alpha-glucanotransferase
MTEIRKSGIILHPTSLPGPDGSGDLGPSAYVWLDALKTAGIGLWQVLPLSPTGYGDSPYQAFSAFAGNPYLISPALLMDKGWLLAEDFADRPEFPSVYVDFGQAIQWKLKILNRAFERFVQTSPDLHDYDSFIKDNAFWLDDFALFMTIKENQNGVAWTDWPEPLRNRQPEAITEFKTAYAPEINRQRFFQYCFSTQWTQLRDFAHQNNIQIVGDIPIFVSHDSADVWANPGLFFLDESGKPTVVAGVPPDYFSPTGQLWGNPHYRWKVHSEDGYKWWLSRIENTLKMVDLIRLDHFRGFAGYWEVPAGQQTAEIGKWVKGPGSDFFNAIRNQLGDLPIIAEDLGRITPDVVKLRDHFNLPGMKILQFAFETDATDPFLPHNYPVNCVAYTGTHDNDTTRGWFDNRPQSETSACLRYLASDGTNIAWDMIRAVWASTARFALAPLQDFLQLGSSARMNFPGKPAGNWVWRVRQDQITSDLFARILELNVTFGRSSQDPVS